MNKDEIAIAIGQKIKDYRLSKNWTQEQLAQKIGMGKSAIANYEKGFRSPKKATMFSLATVFDISIDDLFPRPSKPSPLSSVTTHTPIDKLTEQILETVGELSPNGKKSVLSYASELLEREQDEATLAEQPLFTVYFTSAAKAGPTGFSYDDYDNDKYAYTDEEPPRYDIATMVDGWSMAPDYADGDILYLRDYGTSHYNGQECVVVVDDKNYFKKIYTTDEGLLLVSINEDKDEFPNFTVPFPPNEDTHIKIFEVVGSFTPVEG